MTRTVRLLASAAAVLASGLSVAPTAPAAAQGGPPSPFRSGVDLVPLYVTVTDARGAYEPSLPKAAFEIRDNGQEQPIALFEAGVLPITMAILLDRSPSLFDEARRAQSAITEFTRRLVPGDRACLGFFSHVVSLDPMLTSDPDTLLRHFGDPAPLPAGTALWDALDAARAALAPVGGRRVVLVITDANDNASRSDLEDVRRDFEREGTMLYAIGIRGRSGLMTGTLETMARSSGGWSFELKPTDDLAATMQRVADELHRQYVLAFRPRTLDDKPHRLEVRIKTLAAGKRGLVVRARRSYFAAKDPNAR